MENEYNVPIQGIPTYKQLQQRIAELEAQVKQLQRVPLSEVQRKAAQDAAYEHNEYFGWVCAEKLIDAIEAAHNIK